MTTTTPTTTPNIVCICPYCKTGYEWWVDCDCLDASESDASESDASEAEEYALIVCNYCGNQWDGFAQCNCWEGSYMNYEDASEAADASE